MSRSLENGLLKWSFAATAKNTLASSVNVSGPVNMSQQIVLSDGVSANQANRTWYFTETLASGAERTIDLYDAASLDAGAGAGNDPLGLPVAMEEIVAIAIKNKNVITSTGILTIEPSASNGWLGLGSHTGNNGLRGQGSISKIQPHETGLDVTDLSNHKLKLTAVNADVEYEIIVYGRSDDDESSSSSSSSSSQSSSSSSESSSISSSSVSSSSVSSSSQS